MTYQEYFDLLVKEPRAKLLKVAVETSKELLDAFEIQEGVKRAKELLYTVLGVFIIVDGEVQQSEVAVFNEITERLFGDRYSSRQVAEVANKANKMSNLKTIKNYFDIEGVKENVVKLGSCICAIDGSISSAEQEILFDLDNVQ